MRMWLILGTVLLFFRIDTSAPPPPVPEQSTIILVSAGLLGMLLVEKV